MIAFFKRWRMRQRLRHAVAEDRKRRRMPLVTGTFLKAKEIVVAKEDYTTWTR